MKTFDSSRLNVSTKIATFFESDGFESKQKAPLTERKTRNGEREGKQS